MATIVPSHYPAACKHRFGITKKEHVGQKYRKGRSDNLWSSQNYCNRKICQAHFGASWNNFLAFILYKCDYTQVSTSIFIKNTPNQATTRIFTSLFKVQQDALHFISEKNSVKAKNNQANYFSSVFSLLQTLKIS